MTFIRVPLQFFCTALFLDGPPKSPGGSRAALAAPGLILHLKISLKNRSALVRMRFWFPPD